jgi:regulator of protease activity HflC (stomatin/prohibitin superfamily)
MNKKAQEIGVGILASIILVVIAIIVLAMGFDKVDANHLGVKVKLGEVTGVQHAGIQWTGLFTDVKQYDLRLRKATIVLEGTDSAPDKKGQSVYARIDVNYRIKPTEETVISLWQNVGEDGVIADRLNIEPLITESFKQATVQYEALEILEKRAELKQIAKENIRNNFPKEYFEINDIVISNIHFSEEYEDALDAKQTAIQLALKAENDLEKVKFEQQQEIEKYKAEAEKLRLQRQEITELLVQQKMIDKWDGKLPDQLIITEGSSGMFLQLAKGQTSGVN